MPAEVRACETDGYFEGATCPVCGASGRRVLSGERRRRLSKFASGALRHFPDDAGIELDGAGWTDSDALVAAVRGKYDWATREAVAAVVATDPKGRFERTGPPASDGRPDAAGDDDRANDTNDGRADDTDRDRVRAAYGHSVDVTLDAADTPVPETLYHGTDPENLDAIAEEGLRPMGRQQVHLSGTLAEAREVGRRHADDPAVLIVDAAALRADGHDVTKRGRGVYTTDHVPPAYLAEE
jgi:putative RNA 2'-phosphotransferase